MQTKISVEFMQNVAVLRIARVVNALTFCELVKISRGTHRDAVEANAQWSHATWLLGGYLYEARQLVDDLTENYGSAYHFRELMQFAQFVEPYAELLREMNYNPSFNLDWGGGTSSLMCETAKLDAGDIVRSGDTAPDRRPYYYRAAMADGNWFADTVETQYGRAQTADLVGDGLDLFSKMFRMAARKFLETETGVRSYEPEGSELN